MRRTAALIAALALGLAHAPAARADFEDGFFPLAPGNEWVYEPAGGGPEHVTRIDLSGTYAGRRFFRLLDYNGDARWVQQSADGVVREGLAHPWYALEAPVGASWTFSTSDGALPGSDGARVTVVARAELVDTPAGSFRCLHLRWRPSGTGGEGISDEWFARGVGLVKRRVVRAGGVEVLELVRATVSGEAIPSASGGIVSALGGAAGPGAFGISGQVPASRVRLRVLLDEGLSRPAAMAFHPTDGSLWIVDRAADSVVIVDDPGQPSMRWERLVDDSDHFNNNPLALAFSRSRDEMATALESVNDYNGAAPGNMFAGPTLWPAARSVFTGGAATHLDMLHHSPLAVGIAAGARPTGPDRREYWVFNGDAGSIDRYFFGEPHVLGGHDHSDGLTLRYGSGLRRVAGVPGHLALDVASGTLYIADTGNGRIARLDTGVDLAGTQPIAGYHGETPLYRAPGAAIASVTAPGALSRPAGLILSGGRLVVSDHATGHILVFGLDGTLEGDADTGLGGGALMGLVEAPDGALYVLDGRGGRLLEVDIVQP